MQTSLPLFHFASFLISVGLIILLMLRNPRASLNRFCVFLITTFALWSFGYCCVHLSKSEHWALLWINFSSLGWISFSFASIYFYLNLTNKTHILKNIPLFFLFVIITFFFIFQQWTGHMVASVIQRPWGWAGVWSTSVYSYLYIAYVGISSLACIGLSVNLLRQAHAIREIRVAQWLSITAGISLILGFSTDIVLPILGLNVVPQLADILVMIWELGIILAITRYGLMTITPVTAAERILSTMNDALILTDLEGRIILANRSTVELLEIPEKELIGSNFVDYVLEKNSAKALLSSILNVGNSTNNEFTYISGKDNRYTVQVSASAINDNTQTPLGFVVVARNITEKKIMELRLEKSKSELIESERRFKDLYESEKKTRQELEEEAKSRALFIDILAHELRTPMTPMMTSSGLLEDMTKSQNNELLKRISHNIYSSALNLCSRLEDLLELARLARGTFSLNLQPTDLRVFVEDVVLRFQPTLQAQSQQLVMSLPDKLPVCNIDPGRLEQVIVNLLSNASKFSPIDSNIFFNVRINLNKLHIEVVDSGIGISAEDQQNIFIPYHRVQQDRNKIPGTGLGLAVCKQIIEAHGGEVGVSSYPGKGSMFFFEVPLDLH